MQETCTQDGKMGLSPAATGAPTTGRVTAAAAATIANGEEFSEPLRGLLDSVTVKYHLTAETGVPLWIPILLGFLLAFLGGLLLGAYWKSEKKKRLTRTT